MDAQLTEVVRKQSWRGTEQKEWDKCLGIAANTGGGAKMARSMYHRRTGYWPQSDLHNYLSSNMPHGDVESILSKYRRGKRKYS